MANPGLPPETTLDDVKVRIHEAYKNPNVGKIHQAVLKDGPRTFRLATLLEIIDTKTGGLHHYLLRLQLLDFRSSNLAGVEKSCQNNNLSTGSMRRFTDRSCL